MFGRLLGIYILRLLPPNGILSGAKINCVQVLRSPILAALLHDTRAVAVSQTLWRGTGNEITELSQRAPPIFGWAAITLDIGPYSSYNSKRTSHVKYFFGVLLQIEIRLAALMVNNSNGADADFA